jgi:hypothetical protein
MPTVPKDGQSLIGCVVKAAISGSPSHPVHASAAFPPVLGRLDDRAAASGSGRELPGKIIGRLLERIGIASTTYDRYAVI